MPNSSPPLRHNNFEFYFSHVTTRSNPLIKSSRLDFFFLLSFNNSYCNTVILMIILKKYGNNLNRQCVIRRGYEHICRYFFFFFPLGSRPFLYFFPTTSMFYPSPSHTHTHVFIHKHIFKHTITVQ